MDETQAGAVPSVPLEGSVDGVGECACETDTWVPPGTVAAYKGIKSCNVIVYGKSGVGKSHLVYHLIHDAELFPGLPRGVAYGDPREIVVWMAEDSTTTYDDPLPNIRRVKSIDELIMSLEETRDAALAGMKMPRIGVVDSISGICDYQMKAYKAEQPFRGKSGARDKLAEYGDLGEQMIEALLIGRDEIPFDMVWMCTTWEPGGNMPPQLAVPGKVIPTNLTRLSTSAFYMKAFADEVDKEKLANNMGAFMRPHRTIGMNAMGKPDGNVINRYFLTQDAGEVFAKGHHNLALQERAILPLALRKMHGINPAE